MEEGETLPDAPVEEAQEAPDNEALWKAVCPLIPPEFHIVLLVSVSSLPGPWLIFGPQFRSAWEGGRGSGSLSDN